MCFENFEKKFPSAGDPLSSYVLRRLRAWKEKRQSNNLFLDEILNINPLSLLQSLAVNRENFVHAVSFGLSVKAAQATQLITAVQRQSREEGIDLVLDAFF